MAKKKEMFAVIGLGRFGRTIAKQLYDMDYDVLAIDADEKNIETVADNVTYSVCCDAKNESSLKAAGIEDCTCVIVAIGQDITDSVLTTLILKEIGIKKVICKANDINHKKVLEKIGADMVIIPEYEMGIKIAKRLVCADILDFIDISEKFGIADISVPDSWIGCKISEIDIRRRYKVNVIAIKTGDTVEMLPSADYVFNKDDTIVIGGSYEDIDKMANKI